MMQLPFSCTPATLRAVEATLSREHLSPYLTAAKGDRHLALQFYVWNARICEAFYLPCQIAEIACRNAIVIALVARYGAGWSRDERFRFTLPGRLRAQLGRACDGEGGVAGLTLGFWTHLLSTGFDFTLWKTGVVVAFPHAPLGVTRNVIYDRVNQLRIFRNRIAHHATVFDKRPIAEHQNLLTTVAWVSPETRWLVGGLSGVSRTINARPKA